MGKTPRKKRRTKSVKEKLRDENDELWSDLIHLRDAKQGCLVCGKRKALNAHHLIGRGNFATRYDLSNGVLLCVWHHVFCRKCSPHAGARGWVALLTLKHPHLLAYEVENENRIGSYTLASMQAANEYLKSELRKLKAA